MSKFVLCCVRMRFLSAKRTYIKPHSEQGYFDKQNQLFISKCEGIMRHQLWQYSFISSTFFLHTRSFQWWHIGLYFLFGGVVVVVSVVVVHVYYTLHGVFGLFLIVQKLLYSSPIKIYEVFPFYMILDFSEHILGLH